VLEVPLQRMEMFETPKASVMLEIGDAKLGPYPVTREQFPALPAGAAPHAVFRLSTAEIGGRQVAVLEPDLQARPEEQSQVRLHNFSPTEAFMVAFHVGLYAAIGVSLPFWVYFLGGFIVPALNFRERKLVFSWIGWGAFLFVAGVCGTYFFLLPIALRASVKYSDLLGFSAVDWRADEYIDFTCKFLFGMGVGFQFPLVVLGMVKLGFLTHRHLAKYRRHVIILCLILGAVLTTPEPVTQVAMAVPLYLLYEACIWIAWYWDWKKRRGAGAVES
jgi:sec-independent protein translocase protein TatC